MKKRLLSIFITGCLLIMLLPSAAFASGSPAVGTDGTIYVGSEDDNLYAINPVNGVPKWSFATAGCKITFSPGSRNTTILIQEENICKEN